MEKLKKTYYFHILAHLMGNPNGGQGCIQWHRIIFELFWTQMCTIFDRQNLSEVDMKRILRVTQNRGQVCIQGHRINASSLLDSNLPIIWTTKNKRLFSQEYLSVTRLCMILVVCFHGTRRKRWKWLKILGWGRKCARKCSIVYYFFIFILMHVTAVDVGMKQGTRVVEVLLN